MAVLVPHFDLPFRLAGKNFAVTEQDSETDIGNCVEAILRTPAGTREDLEEFGLTDQVFSTLPLSLEDIAEQVQLQEPRADLDITQQIIENSDILIVTVNK